MNKLILICLVLSLMGCKKEVKKYYPNGNLKNTHKEHNGKIIGEAIEYFESGAVSSVRQFENGLMQGTQKLYYENGKLSAELYTNKGLYEGVQTFYFENGQVKLIRNFVNDSLNGPIVEYFENGILKAEGNYKHGEQDGTFKYYHPLDGILVTISEFKNGQEITRKKYNSEGELTFDYDPVADSIIFPVTKKDFELNQARNQIDYEKGYFDDDIKKGIIPEDVFIKLNTEASNSP